MKLLAGFILLFISAISFSQTTYTWNAASGAWGTATNWTPNRNTPAADDILEFNGAVTATTSVTGVPAETIGKLRVYNNTAVILAASAPITLTIGNAAVAAPHFAVETGSAISLSGANAMAVNIGSGFSGQVAGGVTMVAGAHRLTAASAGALIFQSGGSLTAAPGFTGNAFGTANLNSVIFQSGSIYMAQSGANPFGATAPNAVCVFQTGSLFSYRANLSPSLSGRTYANFEIDAPSFNQTLTGANPFRCDTFTVKNATAVTLNLTAGIMIGGDFTVTAGTVQFTPTAANAVIFDGTVTQNITGTINFNSNTTLVVARTSTVNLNNNITTPAEVIVYGKLNTKTATVTGGSYTSFSPGTLNITGSYTLNNAAVTSVSSTAGMVVGMEVINANVPSGTYVTNITSATAYRVSKFATSTGSGSATQVVAHQATLGIGSPDGISSSGALGNIQTTTRNFISDATYEYNGTAAQVTGDGIPIVHDNLVINNPANVTLSKALNISDGLYLTSGRLIATAFSLNLNTTASIISGAHGYTNLPYTNIGTQNSYVVGFLIRNTTVSTPFVAYPVGSLTQFRPLFIKDMTGTYVGNYTQASPRTTYGTTYGTGIDHVSDIEYWQLTSPGASSGTVELSFYDPNSGGVTNMADLRVAMWTGAQWNDIGNSATLGTPGSNGSVTATAGSTGSVITLASSTAQNPLPLQTMDITATKINRNAQIQWTVNADQDVQEYNLERSVDGRNFSFIHTTPSVHSAIKKAYYYSDAATAGRVYYRVKAVMQNGRSIYSSIIMLPGDGEVIAVYPNPVSNTLNLSVSKPGGQLIIINAAGRMLYKTPVNDQTISINVQQWAKGYYQLQYLQPGSKVQTRTFVVQ